MNGVYEVGKPNPKQELFFKSQARYVGFGGARGGGKSWAVRTKSILLALRYPKIKILIVRRTYPELEENHIRQLRMSLAGIATYNSGNKRFTFKNGSTISCTYCSNDNDLQHVQGTEWHVIFIDEATNLTEYQIKVIMATNRSSDDIPKRMYFTMNPGGVGHAYIKRVFVDRNFQETENPDDYVFIQSLVFDNEYLMKDEDYLNVLKNLPAEKRKGWLYGEWNIFSGQAFPEFKNDEEHYQDRLYTHVIEPFTIPPTWRVERCYDFGYTKPSACYWVAIAPNGQMFVIREYYTCTEEANVGTQTHHMDMAKQIREIENTDVNLKGRKINGVADPAIFDESRGVSIANDMAKAPNYVIWHRGDNSRLAGKMQYHYRLAFDEDGNPMIQFFNTCKHFIRTFPNLMYDEKKTEDIDTSLEDHSYDAIRYLLMDNIIAPRANSLDKAKVDINDPLNQRIKRERIKFSHY